VRLSFVFYVSLVLGQQERKNIWTVSGALEARVTALEIQVAQLKKSIDQIIARPQTPTSVDAKPTPDTRVQRATFEAFKAYQEADRRYKTAVNNTKQVASRGGAAYSPRSSVRNAYNQEYSAAKAAEDAARKEMLEAQKRYQEILQPKPSK
jgi:uncharacterized iron-regulated membrane protein